MFKALLVIILDKIFSTLKRMIEMIFLKIKKIIKKIEKYNNNISNS